MFKSQLVKEGEDFLLKKAPLKTQGFGPYQNKPFRGLHNKKSGSYRNLPTKAQGNSPQSSNQSFSSSRGKPNFRGFRSGLWDERLYNDLCNDCTGREANGPLKRTHTSPIPGRLADQVPVSGGSPSQAVVDLTQSLGWIINQEKSKLKSTQVFSFMAYHLDSALVKPTQERWLKHQDLILRLKTCFDCKMFDVANWVACLNRENDPRGTPSHKALSVSSQGALEISSVAGQPPSLDRNHFCTPRLVAKSNKCDERCRLSSQRPEHPTLYRRLKRRLGRSLKRNLYKGSVVRRKKGLRINVLRLKAVSLAL